MSTVRNRVAAAAAAATLGVAGITAVTASADASTLACGNYSLAVSRTATDGAAGHGRIVLLFRNVSHTTCTLYGYPGLDALNASGQLLAHAKRTLSGYMGGAYAGERTVTITPGHYGSAVVEWLNFNPVTTGDCTFSKSVATTPANTTRTWHLAASVSICNLQVHPTVAGTSGSN
jgi:hypothetical protein